MNNPNLYENSNSLQQRDTLLCLKENAERIKWKKNSRILDIGCADGSGTKSLKCFIPDDYLKLVGCDISEKMITFANAHNGDEKTSFVVLNIEGDMIDDMKDSFDHVFSFYTFHWVKKQEKAYQNIFNLLKDQGDCLLLFVGNFFLFNVYRILTSHRIWSKWVDDVDRYISPYHDSLDPVSEIREMMENIGFHNLDVKCEDASYTYKDIDVFKKSLIAVNPFNIPEELYDIYTEACLEIMEEMKLIERINGSVCVIFDYKLITVYASKAK